jgi:hypothetical protein
MNIKMLFILKNLRKSIIFIKNNNSLKKKHLLF